MNMPNLNTPPAPATKSKPEAAAKPSQPPQRPRGEVEHRQGEQFARLLQAKAAAQGDFGAESGAEPLLQEVRPDPSVFAFAAILPLRGIETEAQSEALPTDAACTVAAAGQPGTPLESAAPIQNSPPAMPEAGISASRAAIEAALKGDAAPPVSAAGGAEAAWEASIREPNGVAVEIRATRTLSPGAGETQTAWNLTVASPAMEAALLARHTPRLSERLRTRAVEHVRIEANDAHE